MRTLFLTLITCLFVLPAYAKYSGGTGEPNDPYRIATATDLIALGETPEDYDKHFILTADIDLDPNLPGRKVFDKAVIAPDKALPFTGIFDGKGHTVSHLTIRGGRYAGLLGSLVNPAEVKDLGVVDGDVHGSGSYVGGLVGYNHAATVTDCYSTGRVSGTEHTGGLVGANYYGTVTHCYSMALVIGNSDVGGLVGDNYYNGTVTQCYSTGAVTGTDWGVGGLVGANREGTLTKCHSTGTVSGNKYVGGLVGHGDWGSRITTSYSTGAVTGKEDVGGLVGYSDYASIDTSCSTGAVSGTSYVGGLVGFKGESSVTDCYSTGAVGGNENVGGLVGLNDRGDLSKCYSTGLVRGNSYVGGLVGSNTYKTYEGVYESVVIHSFWDTQTSGQTTSAAGTGKSTAQMQEIQTYLDAGWDFVAQPDGPHDIWARPEGGGYPILWWQLSPWPELPGFSGGSGEPDDPYLISTAEQLNSIGHNPRLMTCHFQLVQDLDLTGLGFYPIGGNEYPYIGVFDGNGRTISRLTITGGKYLGLFGQLGRWDASAGQVKDLGVVDINIVGSDFVGGLVGYKAGGTVTRCYSVGTVSGGRSVGGLVGFNWEGTVTQSYSTGSVSGSSSVGGLVGSNLAGSIATSYSSGSVSGGSDLSGLVGSQSDSDAISCFWDMETSGQATSAGGTGKTTAEMQTASTFLNAGWDFVGETANGTEDIWWILEGKDYPRLSWEPRKYGGGTGEPNDPYQIATTADLIALGETPGDYGKHFILTADIDLDPNLPGRKVFDKAVVAPGWETPFNAVFDGNGHTISNLTIRGKDYLGLFGILGSEVKVRDLGVVNVNITGSGDGIGGLVGANDGSVVNCYSTGSVNGSGYVGGLVGSNLNGHVKTCFANSIVMGTMCVGGLAGYNACGGFGCWPDSGITNCYVTGTVVGSESVGGLVGMNGCHPDSCFTPCIGLVTNCHSASGVSGIINTGGLVGSGSASDVTGSFWDTLTSGQVTSAGGTGKTTPEMQTAKTFLDAGWDFVGETANGTEDIWWILEGKDYPRLWWEAEGQ